MVGGCQRLEIGRGGGRAGDETDAAETAAEVSDDTVFESIPRSILFKLGSGQTQLHS